MGGWWSFKESSDARPCLTDARPCLKDEYFVSKADTINQDFTTDKWLDGIPRPNGIEPSLQLSLMEHPRIIPGNASKGVRKKPKKNNRYCIGQGRPLMTLPTDEILKKHVNQIGSLFKPPRQRTKVVSMRPNNPPWNDRHSVSDSKDNSARHDHFRQYFTKPSDPAGSKEGREVTVVDTFLSTAPHSLFDVSVMDTYPEAPSVLPFASQEEELLDMLDTPLMSTLRPEDSMQIESPVENEDEALKPVNEDSPAGQEKDRTRKSEPDAHHDQQSARKSSVHFRHAHTESEAQVQSRMLKELLHSQPDARSESDQFFSLANAGVNQFKKFFQWAKDHYGSLVRCWNVIDANNDMILSKAEFFKNLVESGYKASELKDLWAIFDRDHTDTVAFHHFDPDSALHLSAFKQWACQEFGSIHNLCTAWDHKYSNDNGKLTLTEFTNGCEDHGLTSTHTIRCLFQMCGSSKNISPSTFLQLDNLHFLDSWDCGEHLNAIPDSEGQKLFKKQLLRMHKGNALSAWRKDIDRDGSMRVNYLEFQAACKKVQRQQKFEGKLDIGGVWRAFDSNFSGWLSLKEFDEMSHSDLVRFKTWVISKYGSTTKFIREVGVKESHLSGAADTYSLSWKKFCQHMNKTAKDVFGPKAEGHRESPSEALEGASGTVDMLVREEVDNSKLHNFFDALDIDNSGVLTAANLRFLDHWDTEKENAEELAWSKLANTRQELKTQFVRDSMRSSGSSPNPN